MSQHWNKPPNRPPWGNRPPPGGGGREEGEAGEVMGGSGPGGGPGGMRRDASSSSFGGGGGGRGGGGGGGHRGYGGLPDRVPTGGWQDNSGPPGPGGLGPGGFGPPGGGRGGRGGGRGGPPHGGRGRGGGGGGRGGGRGGGFGPGGVGGGGGRFGPERNASFGVGDGGPMPSPRRSQSFGGMPQGGGGGGGFGPPGGVGGAGGGAPSSSPMPDRPGMYGGNKAQHQRAQSFGGGKSPHQQYHGPARSPEQRMRQRLSMDEPRPQPSPRVGGVPQPSPRGGGGGGGGGAPWRRDSSGNSNQRMLPSAPALWEDDNSPNKNRGPGRGPQNSNNTRPSPFPSQHANKNQGDQQQQEQQNQAPPSPTRSTPGKLGRSVSSPSQLGRGTSGGGEASTGAAAENKDAAPLTVTSLSDDKVDKAEKAVRRLSTLAGKDSQGVERSSLVLPSKQQILGAMSTLESKIKTRKKETDSLQTEISDARKKEALELEKERERKDLEERRKVAAERRREEEKEREKLRKEEEERRKVEEDERRRKAARKKAKEMTRRRQEQVEEDRKERVAKLQAELRARKEKEREVIRSLKRKRHGPTIDELEASVQEASTEEQKAAAEAMSAEEGAQEAIRRARVASEAAEAERRLAEEFRQTGGIGLSTPGKKAKKLPRSVEQLSEAMDRPECGSAIGMGNLVKSIVAANRNAAAAAHKASLAAIPYTPIPPTQGKGEGMGGLEESKENEPQRTNEEWTTLARQVTGLADALYVDPTEAPSFTYNEENHAAVGPLVREHVRAKRRKLHSRFVELGTEFVVRKQKYDDAKADEAKADAASVAQEEEEQKQDSGGRSSNPYRRARRGDRGGGSGIGVGDFASSEYEQEQIIAKITAQEQMEKRIKLGGCALPRQILGVEKGLSATYYDTQETKKIDFIKHEEEIKYVNPWTDVEKCIFLDRFLQHPKDFRKIASFLKNKTTRDCVAFYYDSKQTIPYKRALREHLQRKKRKIDPKWDATIQSALCVGAVVTAGSGPDKPLKFSLPSNDFTFHTRLFHPMKRDIFDRITGEEDECDVPDNSKKRWVLFSLDKSARKYLKQKDTPSESLKKSGSVSGDDNGGTSAASSRSSGGEKKKKSTAPSIDKGGIDLNSPAGAKKAPQKWTAEEKQIFFDTVERHGKNWSVLQNAVPSKSLSQIKNYYYDHKKQFGKQEVANGTPTIPATSTPVSNHSGTNTPMMEQQLYQKVVLENGQEVLLTPGGSLAQMGQNADVWTQAQQQLAFAMQQQQQQQHADLNQQNLMQQASWVAAAQQMAQARAAQVQAQAAAFQQQQQQQQHEMPSAAMLRDWLESQAAGQQNANLALAQQLAAAQNGGGFTGSGPSPQPQINSLALAGLLGQNLPGMNNGSLGMATPDEAGLQSNLNAALLSQLTNANMSAVHQGGGNVGQQQQPQPGTSSTPPADALALLARLSGANNGDGRHQM